MTMSPGPPALQVAYDDDSFPGLLLPSDLHAGGLSKATMSPGPPALQVAHGADPFPDLLLLSPHRAGG